MTAKSKAAGLEDAPMTKPLSFVGVAGRRKGEAFLWACPIPSSCDSTREGLHLCHSGRFLFVFPPPSLARCLVTHATQ